MFENVTCFTEMTKWPKCCYSFYCLVEVSFISLVIFQSSGLGSLGLRLQLFLYQNLLLNKSLDDLKESVYNCEALVCIWDKGWVFHSEPLFLVQILAFIS